MSISLRKNFTFYQDAWPLGANIFELRDYVSHQICSLCSLPLLKNQQGTLKDLAAFKESLISNSEKTQWEIKLNLKMIQKFNQNNHSPGKQYLENLLRLNKDPPPQIKGFFKNIKNIQLIKSDGLIFDLFRPDRFFAYYLAHPSTSPLNQWGAYSFFKKNKKNIKLISNGSFYPQHTITFEFPELNQDPFRVDDFLQNKIDLTADTAFPYSKFDQLKNKKEFFLHQDPILIHLMADQKTLINNSICRFANLIINREIICKELFNVPQVHLGMSNSYQFRDYAIKEPPKGPISIAFEDFYPNQEIVNNLQKQFQQWGIKVIQQKCFYGELHQIKADLKLKLFYKTFNTTFNFFLSMTKHPFFQELSQSLRQYYLKLIFLYRTLEDERQLSLIANRLDAILLEHGIYIPLLALPRMGLSSLNISHDDIYQPGVNLEKNN